MASPDWINGTALGAGAVTFGHGATGSVGVVTATNSLVGSTAGDRVGSGNVLTVSDNSTFWNLAISSPEWGSGGLYAAGKGAVTWMNGSTGELSTSTAPLPVYGGIVEASNSLLGLTAGDRVGVVSDTYASLTGMNVFGNGNLLIRSPNWNGQFSALTWMSGSNGALADGTRGGMVSSANSILGSALGDDVGSGGDKYNAGVTVLSGNGNWVITSPSWSSNKGAATWINSATGHLADGQSGGVLAAANSLVGTTNNDRIGGMQCGDGCGAGRITALSDGNYVVNSTDRIDPINTLTTTGAVTWGNGVSGTVGSVTAANSALVMVYSIAEVIPGQVLVGSSGANAGAGGVYLVGATGSGGSPTFAASPAGDATVGAGYLSNALNLGTNVVLQANTDITVNAPIAVTGQTPGNLTLQAGRSVVLNAGISTGGADLTVATNDSSAIGANRDAGVGAFINNAGSGALTTGAGRWLVYSTDPGSDAFGGLSSDQLPLWGKTYASYPVVTETGNRYLFDTVPSLTANVVGGSVVKTYGTTTATPSVSVTGLVNAAAYGGVFTQESYASTLALTSIGLAANARVNGSPYPVTFSGTLLAPIGYASTLYETATVTVMPASLTATISNAGTSKVYDGTVSATVTGGSLVGVLSGDVVSLNSSSANFNNKNVGVAKSVTVTGLSLSGADAGNYTLSTSSASTSADITPKPLSVSAVTAANKVYDGSTAATLSGAVLSGAVAGDNVALGTPTGAFSDKNAGLGKSVNITGLTLTGSDAVNYSVGNLSASATADITPKPVSVSAVTAANKVYDGSTAATVSGGVLLGAVAGDNVALGTPTGAFSDKNVGLGKTVNITGLALTGSDAVNYSVGSLSASATADITPKPLSVSAVTVANKVYDGSAAATVSGGVLSGAVAGDNVALGTPTGAFSDKNVGLGKTVAISGLSLSGSDALNYTLGSTVTSTTADISKAVINGVSGITVNDKVYDGNTTATAVTSGASLTGLISGDQVTVGSVESAFVDRNVGRGKLVNLSNLTLSGPDSANYSVATGITPLTGNITVRALSTWTAAGSGQWSSAGSWDALPDASNVLAVSIPAGVSVAYDAAVADTHLQSITGAGSVSMAGGSLSIANSVSLSQYAQVGGALSLSGAFNVNGSFNQTAGTIVAGGPVDITHTAGNLTVASIQAPVISLAAPTGSIDQNAGLVTGLLSTQSATGTRLNDAGNRIGSFRATNSGGGSIELTNVGVLDGQGISVANGDIKLFNTGGISTSGPVLASAGAVTMTANSPLTIGSGGISASGDIVLTATNLTSSGNMTLNGALASSVGGITLNAANNFVQNSTLTAALAINVSAGGTLTFGPLAKSTGHPVNYYINGVSVAPPWVASAVAASTSDLITSFLVQFQSILASPILVSSVALVQYDNNKNTVVVEGDICAH